MRPLAVAVLPVLAGLVFAATPVPAVSAATPAPVVSAAAPAPVASAAASAPPRTPIGTVLVVTDVGESAQSTLPSAVWRKLVVDYVGAHAAVAEDGTALPDESRCRSAHAGYAIFATFDRAMRLPGFAQDTDRAYGIARFTVRNCQTGAIAPMKTVRIESEPLAEAVRGEGDAAVAAGMWQRAVRMSLAHDPLVLAPLVRTTRIAGIVDGVVYLDSGDGLSVNQMLRDYADRNAHPHAPIELVVVEITRRYVAASVVGGGTPRVGDYVDTAPAK